MYKCLLLALGLVGLALTVEVPAQEEPAEETKEYQVIIHTDNPVVEMSAKDIAKLFLRKIKRWDHDKLALPVDLRADHPARVAFTTHVHNKSVSAIQSYWQRMIFSGRGEPPREVGDEAEALAYVRANAGAIGYVSGDTPLGAGVKVLKITS